MTKHAAIKPIPFLENLVPYQPGMSIEDYQQKYSIEGNIYKLASNENPYGPSPKAVEVLKNGIEASMSQYPDNSQFTEAIASKFEVDSSMILVGNGSNDVIDVIARSYLGDGSEAISAEFAFVAYGISTTLSGARNVIVPAVNYGHDLDAMARAITDDTKIIWIANPNNPTGSFIDGKVIKEFLETIPERVLVVLDEAYSEYLTPEDSYDSIKMLTEHKNLILIRTMSKIYGLAGLRLGYGIADPKIVDYLNRARQPFNANSLALSAGMAALNDTNYIEFCYQKNLEGMQIFREGLDKLGIDYLNSKGNFLTVKFDDASSAHEYLLQKGIITRPLTGYKMSNYVRITVGKLEDVRYVKETIRAFLTVNQEEIINAEL